MITRRDRFACKRFILQNKIRHADSPVFTRILSWARAMDSPGRSARAEAEALAAEAAEAKAAVVEAEAKAAKAAARAEAAEAAAVAAEEADRIAALEAEAEAEKAAAEAAQAAAAPGAAPAAPSPSAAPGAAPSPSTAPGAAPSPSAAPGAAPSPSAAPGAAPSPSAAPGAAPSPSSAAPGAAPSPSATVLQDLTEKENAPGAAPGPALKIVAPTEDVLPSSPPRSPEAETYASKKAWASVRRRQREISVTHNDPAAARLQLPNIQTAAKAVAAVDAAGGVGARRNSKEEPAAASRILEPSDWQFGDLDLFPLARHGPTGKPKHHRKGIRAPPSTPIPPPEKVCLSRPAQLLLSFPSPHTSASLRLVLCPPCPFPRAERGPRAYELAAHLPLTPRSLPHTCLTRSQPTSYPHPPPDPHTSPDPHPGHPRDASRSMLLQDLQRSRREQRRRYRNRRRH